MNAFDLPKRCLITGDTLEVGLTTVGSIITALIILGVIFEKL